LYSEIPEGLYEQNLECKVIYLEYINWFDKFVSN
jgi:hypothetical protein